MDNMLTLACIKCNTPYQTEDPDPYYCEACNAHRLAVAKELDSKPRPQREHKSALQEYDSAPKVMGRFIVGKL